MTGNEKAIIAKNATVAKKGYGLQFLDVGAITEIADIFFLAQGRNRSQTQAIADEIMEKLEEQGELPLRREGYENGGWILLDYGDLVVHIFMPEEYEYFNLPRLWQDAVFTRFDENGDPLPKEEKAGETGA
ncbi:MAG: ribosome silencing factor [Bacillota bacterium]|nr:ribosome silencing factor [Bacillota bacterium]